MRRRSDLVIVFGSISVAVILCLVILALFSIFKPTQEAQAAPTVDMLIIPAPTETATPLLPVETPTETFVPDEKGIVPGVYVQISGTDGEGLRLRSGPGIDQSARFLGMDAEVFEVVEGPKRSDGYTWWFLVAPYDKTRSGWAASDFLTVVAQPTPEPA